MMADYIHIQQQIDAGLGVAALHIGQPHSVYRPSANAALDLVDPKNLIASAVPVFKGRFKGGIELIASGMGSLALELAGDFQPYFTGDVFVQTDPAFPSGYGAGATLVDFTTEQMMAFCLAFHPPLQRAVGVWLNQTAQIYRPSSLPNSENYWTLATANSRPLQLSNGQFLLGTAGKVAAKIPVGFQATRRLRGDLFKAVPDATSRVEYFIYLPPLPGFRIAEADWIVFTDNSRYQVAHPYAQESGIVGTQAICHRVVAQP